MEIGDIKKIIEALLFVSDKPLLNREIRAVVKDDLPENVKLEDIMQELQQEYVQLNRAYDNIKIISFRNGSSCDNCI